MSSNEDTLETVRAAARLKIVFLPHAITQITRPDRMIATDEIRSVVETGELIENYPEDARGHSCLILGHGDQNRPIHVVCAPKNDYLAIISAYLPETTRWSDDFRERI